MSIFVLELYPILTMYNCLPTVFQIGSLTPKPIRCCSLDMTPIHDLFLEYIFLGQFTCNSTNYTNPKINNLLKNLVILIDMRLKLAIPEEQIQSRVTNVIAIK